MTPDAPVLDIETTGAPDWRPALPLGAWLRWRQLRSVGARACSRAA